MSNQYLTAAPINVVTFSAGVSIHGDAPHIRLADGVEPESAARSFCDFVEQYIGLDKAEIDELRALLRRWVACPEVTETYPEDRDPETEKLWRDTRAALARV